jgi:hypothetical protein
MATHIFMGRKHSIQFTNYLDFVFSFFLLKTVLAVLQRIEHGLKEIKITRKEAPASYPELMKMIKNHTSSSDYMIQFTKKPIAVALAMIFFSAIPNFHVLRRLKRIFMLAKDH